MSRLDPKGSDFKGPKRVVTMGPSVEEVKESMARTNDDGSGIKTAATYNSQMQEKRSHTEKLKGRGQPLGGAPPLDPQKMRGLAESLAPKPNFDDPPASQPEPEEPRREAPPSVQGVGSAYQVNQDMAQGKIGKPVSLRGAKQMVQDQRSREGQRQPLSPETIEGLEKAQGALEQEEESPQEYVDEDDTSRELEKADKDVLDRDAPDLFNFGNIQEQQRVLMDRKRKESIEADLEPLSIEDMIVSREIQQVITVVPGKLFYRLRTFNQKEHLFCLQYVYEHPGSVFYTEEFLNTCKLVCALVAINGAFLPTHMKDNEVDKKLFEKKMSHVASLPTQLISDLSVQVIWFNERVTALFSLENLKNG